MPNCPHCLILQQLKRLNTFEGKSHIEHITTVHLEDDQDISDHEQSLLIQKWTQLMHNTKLCNGVPSHKSHLLLKQELQLQDKLNCAPGIPSRQ